MKGDLTFVEGAITGLFSLPERPQPTSEHPPCRQPWTSLPFVAESWSSLRTKILFSLDYLLCQESLGGEGGGAGRGGGERRKISRDISQDQSSKITLTTQECFQTKQLDLLLPLNQVRSSKRRGTWPRPVHFALAQPDGINGVSADLQDQSPVHDIQQLTGEQLLLLVGDVLWTWELDLLQADRTKELLLVRHGAQVPIEEPTALRVAHCHSLPVLLPTVLKLDVQVSHYKRETAVSPVAQLSVHP